MMPIKKIMKKDISKLSSLDSVGSAAKVMEKMNLDYSLIEEEGKIRGIVTSHKLLGYFPSRLILDCEIEPIDTISGEILLDEALKILEEKKVNFLMILDKEGTPIGVVNREMIISFLCQELKRSNKELKVLDKAKSGFITLASHELKTPLTIIHGYLSLFHDGTLGEINDIQKEKLANVIEETEKLMKMIGNMLNLSIIEAGKLDIRKEKIAVGEIVVDAIEMMMPIAHSKKQKIIIEKPEKVSFILGDKDRIYTVFRNLIDNAVKYAPENGEIVVKVKDNNENLHFTVSDNGPGISSKDLEKIFDRFYTAESTLRRKGSGIGIGLSLCKGIIDAHHGEIWAESKKSKGSTFHVLLPKWR